MTAGRARAGLVRTGVTAGGVQLGPMTASEACLGRTGGPAV
ncbi:hypothetical protein ACIQKE_21510 [Streptomyces griseoviridis]